MLDGTFAIDKSLENVKRAVKRDYDTSTYYVYQNLFIARAFTQLRQQTEGRYVPKAKLIKSYFNSRKNVKKVMKPLKTK
ncbi:hypothetical protein GLW17_04575 [Tetragenococcus halophilus]|uniref:UDP-N-acetylglucosamine kinase n=1 Tax=Tetragenococcus halophilus TaxID=51669 RepID=A0AB37D7F6_TETHA|nr:hypothetical protein GLW17_04575 [Tetragenococcus halophilus]